MRIEDDKEALNTINSIIEKGNIAEIKKFRYGYSVSEVKRKIIMKPPEKDMMVK